MVHERSAIVYDARGQVLSEKGRTRQGADWLYTHTVNHYSADGAGADQPAISWSGSSGSSSGSLLYYSETKNWKNGSNPPAYLSSADYAYADAYTRQSYRWREGAQQNSVRLVNRDGTSTSAYGYDNSGDLASVTIAGGARPRTIAYTHTAAGQVLSRREADRNYSQNDPSQRSYVFGGKQMGSVGNDGTGNVDTAAAIAARTAADGSGAFRGGATYASVHADFDQTYTALGGQLHAESAGGYSVQGGETLGSIAAQLWGDAGLWYKLAEANGLTGSEPLTAGRTLIVPSGVSNIHNTAQTFRPYDPAQAIGNTSPNTPLPPKAKQGCGGWDRCCKLQCAVAVSALRARSAAVGTARGAAS